jgi:hypothetical protein
MATILARFIGAVAILMAGATLSLAQGDEHAIRHLLHTTFDKPDSKVKIDPVVVVGDHALVGWTQGDLGGRALMRRRHGTWHVHLCSGDSIKASDALQQTGISAPDADKLARDIELAERAIAPERRAQFSRFEGTVMMDASGAHPKH